MVVVTINILVTHLLFLEPSLQVERSVLSPPEELVKSEVPEKLSSTRKISKFEDADLNEDLEKDPLVCDQQSKKYFSFRLVVFLEYFFISMFEK